MGYVKAAVTFFTFGFSFMIISGPLHEAARRKNREEILKILTASPSLVNDANEEGETALSIAARQGDFQTFNLLLDKGADTHSIATLLAIFFSGLSAYGLHRSMNESASHEEVTQEAPAIKMHRSGFKAFMFSCVFFLLARITPKIYMEFFNRRTTVPRYVVELLSISGFGLFYIYYTLKTFYYLGKHLLQKPTASSASSSTSDTAIA